MPMVTLTCFTKLSAHISNYSQYVYLLISIPLYVFIFIVICVTYQGASWLSRWMLSWSELAACSLRTRDRGLKWWHRDRDRTEIARSRPVT